MNNLTINTENLQKYANAFIMYEIAVGGIDPRETLKGTTLRRKTKSGEGYKYDVFDKYHQLIQNGGPYSKIIIDAIPEVNLVSFYQQDRITQLLKDNKTDDFEMALRKLYESNDDEAAFNEITKSLGRTFDVIGFIFFLKDCTKYMPIRSRLFDERFGIIGIESDLSGNCSWEKYQEYNNWFRIIQEFFVSHINEDFTLLDAHSFVWILPRISEYLDQGVQVVEHDKFGKGLVVGFENDLVLVRFGKTIRKFDKESAFRNEFLKIIPTDFSLTEGQTTLDQERSVLNQQTRSYIVFQGSHNEKEYACGYLWAPIESKAGTTLHYWDRLTEIKPGDLIFHYRKGLILAISTATSSWFEEDRPLDLHSSDNWNKKGRRVNCDPIILDNPINIEDYKEEIIKYRNTKYSGFSSRGRANQGYLFELEPELSDIFIKAAGISKPSAISTSNELHVVGTYSSWTIKNGTIAIKHCDKSFFDYRGSTIPREVYWFFEAEDLKTGERRDIQLRYKGVLYNAYLQREIHELQRIRIFWHQDLAEEFEKFNDPENTDSLVFYKTGSTTYDVSFAATDSLGKILNDGEDEELLPEEIIEDDQESIIEGAKKKITVNAYERDPKAKKKCKDYYLKKDGRIICQVCGFDFGQVYGPEYANKIHVHHIVPISEIGEEYVVDPVKDLIPVCPNCHMILHAGKGISVADLKIKIGK